MDKKKKKVKGKKMKDMKEKKEQPSALDGAPSKIPYKLCKGGHLLKECAGLSHV